jgi:hypothetical protein
MLLIDVDHVQMRGGGGEKPIIFSKDVTGKETSRPGREYYAIMNL